MQDKEIITSANLKFRILLQLNTLIFGLSLIGGYFGGVDTFAYCIGFYAIETLMFIVLFIPVFVYWVLKGKTIKLSASKAMLSFGDFYQNLTSW